MTEAAEHTLATLDPNDARLDSLLAAPTTVAEALERCARIDAMTAWLGDARTAIRDGYLSPTADATEQATGGRFNVPVNGLGTVYRTDPQPKPYVADGEAFARWYLADVEGVDPDDQPGEAVVRFDCDVVRRTVAEAPSDALLAFLNDVANAWPDAVAAAATVLVDRITTDVEWVLPAGLLDDLLAAKVAARDTGRARVALATNEAGYTVVDTATGEAVPGVGVQDPAAKQLTVKPDAAARRRIRAELDELLGRPALRD